MEAKTVGGVGKWEPSVLFAWLVHHLNQELGDIEALIGDDTGIPRRVTHGQSPPNA